MILSKHDWKYCLKQLKKICPPELKSGVEVYDFLKDDKKLTEDQQHMLNRLWLDHVHNITG